MPKTIPLRAVAVTAALVTPSIAFAQAPAQKVSPPVSQAWIDLATFGGIGMPGLGGGGAGANPMAALGGLFGGGGGKNDFGRTHTGMTGRWMDVTLMTRANPNLAEATMAVPAGSQLAPTLKLVAPRTQKSPPPEPGDESVIEGEPEKPRGKVSLYWGCGETVRAGQPRTIDFARAQPADLVQVFQGRRATQRGTHLAVGRPVWPNEQDSRLVPARATLAGEHGFTGAGVPEGFRFTLPPAQDLMPPLELTQSDAGGATKLRWNAIPTARAYFVAAMGSKAGDDEHMVLWTSSELPDSGFGLLDYQTNAAVDRWLREKVLLAPTVTECTVPRGIFGSDGAMLRAIAYGSELNLAHPPRPSDPRVAWEPQWAVKVRVKSMTTAMLGMDGGGVPSRDSQESREPAGTAPERPAQPPALPNPVDVLRGILGR